MKPQLKHKNLAMGHLQMMKGTGGNAQLREKYTPDNVANAKVIRISNTENVEKDFLSFNQQEKRTLWYAVLIAMAIVVLFVLAIKYKYLKL